MKISYAIYLIFIFMVFVFSSCKQERFSKIVVDNRLTINVPINWHIRPLYERKKLAAIADSVFGLDSSNITSFTAISLPEPADGIIRVSFFEDVYSSQDDLRKASRNNMDSILNWYDSIYTEIIHETNAKNGRAIFLDDPIVSIDSVDHLFCIRSTYHRASGTEQSPFKVQISTIPLGEISAMITASCVVSKIDSISPILDSVMRSVRFIDYNN